MKLAVFSTHAFERKSLEDQAQKAGHQLTFLKTRLVPETVNLAKGFDAVCLFVNDEASQPIIEVLASFQIQGIAMRAAGYNNVDLEAVKNHGLKLARVPAYSPHAVAEHTVALILCLNRKIHHAYNRTRDQNFELSGLSGFDMYGKTVGLIGFGKIGQCTARILKGFGCHVLVSDPYASKEIAAEIDAEITDIDTLTVQADIISLHVPLMPETRHIINAKRVQQMKDGVMLINTSRGALVDTSAALEGIKTGKIGYLGIDVYEREQELFFEDHFGKIMQDDVFARLMSFPNVLVTGHQAFLTTTALDNIAETTMQNVTAWENGTLAPGEILL